MTDKIAICLWFDGNGEDAARFYVSLLPDSSIDKVSQYEGGKTLFVEFTLAGRRFQALNGGPHYELTPAASMAVTCDDQAEVDRLWNALVEGGKAMQCGWLTDRFGLSWQIIPEALWRLMNDPDPVRAGRVRDAMLQMVKIEVPGLEAAWRGDA